MCINRLSPARAKTSRRPGAHDTAVGVDVRWPPKSCSGQAARAADADEGLASESCPRRGGYRPWAELLARTFGADVLAYHKCHGRMKLVSLIKEPRSITRFLTALGEPTDVPLRSPSRGPPYWKVTVRESTPRPAAQDPEASGGAARS